MGLYPDTLRQPLKTEPQSPLINMETDTNAGQPQTHRHWQIFTWSDTHRGRKPYRGMPAYTEAWACVGQLRHINVPIASATDTPTPTGQAVGLRLRSFLDTHRDNLCSSEDTSLHWTGLDSGSMKLYVKPELLPLDPSRADARLEESHLPSSAWDPWLGLERLWGASLTAKQSNLRPGAL